MLCREIFITIGFLAVFIMTIMSFSDIDAQSTSSSSSSSSIPGFCEII